MKLGDVLARIEGLEKRFVYYLEAQGDIRPKRLPKARIARRDYSPEDLRRIARLWDYYRRGYALSTARDLLASETGERSFVFLPLVQRRTAEALELLQRCERVLDVAGVYGETADLVVEAEAARLEDVYQLLHPVFDRGLIAGAPRIFRARAAAEHGRPGEDQVGMLAYVLIKVPAKQIDGVLHRLREFDGIVEASVVYGETDIIAKLQVPDQNALDDLIVRNIQDLPEVQATRTFIAVGGMHWQRS